MNPSSSPGRTRPAPSFRRYSLLTLTCLATACSHARVPTAGKPNDAPKAAATATVAEPLAGQREGGTGTRAKGEAGALRRDSSLVPQLDEPKEAQSLAAAPAPAPSMPAARRRLN